MLILILILKMKLGLRGTDRVYLQTQIHGDLH